MSPQLPLHLTKNTDCDLVRNEPFPNKMLICGHSRNCSSNRREATNQEALTPTRPSQLTVPPEAAQPLPGNRLAAPDNVVKTFFEAQGAIPSNSKEWIVVHNDRFTVCNRQFAIKLPRCFHNDDSRAVVQQYLGCRIQYFTMPIRNDLSTRGLLLWTEPFRKDDKASRMMGDTFLQGWVKRTLSENPIQFLGHWETACKNLKIMATENHRLSHLLVLNSKYACYSIQDIDRLQKAYFQDPEGNRQVGEILRCRLIWGRYIDGALYLLALPSLSQLGTSDLHPKCGIT